MQHELFDKLPTIFTSQRSCLEMYGDDIFSQICDLFPTGQLFTVQDVVDKLNWPKVIRSHRYRTDAARVVLHYMKLCRNIPSGKPVASNHGFSWELNE